MTEQLPSGQKLRAVSSKLLTTFPLNCWHEKAVGALKDFSSSPIAVACSGGADSTFALLMVYAAFPHCRDRICVLHFNHGLREESDKDEEFVSELARLLELKHSIYRPSSPRTKDDEGTLRDERLESFIKFCKSSKTKLLIQGHNQDDVAETMIWRLARGASPQGLCAPRPVHKHGQIHIVRPFITINREDIRAKLADFRIPWCNDKSNESSYYLRNRIRKNGLRQLKEDADRDLLGGMSRSRDLLEEQEEAVNDWVERVLGECISNNEIDTKELRKLPQAIRRKVAHLWLSNQSESISISAIQMDRILRFVKSGGNLDLSLSSSQRIRGNEHTIFLHSNPPKATGWERCSVAQNHTLYLPDKGFILARTLKSDAGLVDRILAGQVEPAKEAFISGQGNGDCKLFARTRLPGDLYRPIGAPGNKKVKNWMIDRKLDATIRDSMPMITNSSDEIIWIPGLPPAESHRIQGDEEVVIHLTYEHSAT